MADRKMQPSTGSGHNPHLTVTFCGLSGYIYTTILVGYFEDGDFEQDLTSQRTSLKYRQFPALFFPWACLGGDANPDL